MICKETMKLIIAAEYELESARIKHPPMHSYHEGLAIIQEEFEEFKTEIFKRDHDPLRIREELIQIVAMCMAFDAELLPEI
jgi:hypothetical protein